MDNFYYYFFYKLGNFFKWVNRRQKDIYRFSSYIFISVCQSLNVLSFLLYLNTKIWFHLNSFTTYMITIPIIILNYFILMKNGKDKKIFDYYDKFYTNKRNNKFSSAIIILYVSLTFAICTFLVCQNKVHYYGN